MGTVTVLKRTTAGDWKYAPHRRTEKLKYFLCRNIEKYLGRLLRPLSAKQPGVHQLTVPVKGLSRPITALHLTDLHAARWISTDYLTAILDKSQALKPDLVLWTGDFIHTDLNELKRLLPMLEPLHRQAPCFGVLGNHEYLAPLDAVVKVLEHNGISLLRNQTVSQTVGGVRLKLCGIDDMYVNNGNLNAEHFKRDHELTILLSHQPDYIFKLPANAVDLVLSGHLHGGQLNFPLVGPIYLPAKNGRAYIDTELFTHNGNRMHTGVGLGYTFIPFRLRCPPKIGCIRFQPQSG